MYKILEKKLLAPNIYLMDVHVPRIAKSAKPGQFVIVRVDEKSERIPLTICDYDTDKETVTIVFQVVGNSTKKMESLEIGDYFEGFAGPLGQPSELIYEKEEDLRKKNILYIAGGVGAAPVYPQVKWLNSIGVKTDVIIGAKTKDLIILEEEMKKEAGNLYIATDDGSYGYKGLVTDLFKDLVENKNKEYDLVVTIGPMIMMKFVTKATKEYGVKTIASLNTLMVDGTGMCGACRVTVGGETKFTCVDGPEFDGHLVDFDEALRRQGMYKTEEGKALLEKQEREEGHVCHVGLGGDH
ncbi:sulfide/dihydroorotate dehydrogenase-like FAD/NAD-binding protein [Clostridium cochlearium]|uniref:Sulfide dehydrogenase (Flavoprotein) subunit SudB n=1 Tax=Clostridium cochlearium TaxID=1494 RepID=A0ABY0QIR9_CLOCO|nr:sulfide/dihydroorotate dehydrogenase-like FAD/NAD-binding protein [Clostridium cochlearium]MBV1816703.1 sulfide/dihydroorotate dehydrogenase-like FAD/NAD-binding protein [Bacteroidales bacterium MSK.15.36]NSJ90346.1 sulfide/dihydroorotate dehydrogenase-like FAD/NAD-binding protein [Coprococcus sp. MSK.21.13]MCG4571024.1 sulfide/dihydroorotate dehydrogenase-like FAD/NAD-binding protein [Clostridium cochlearium]MCG4579139.1 sulfide/dihydroorotate dehydrogenase-like FAD/NAD-binding protein [Clo